MVFLSSYSALLYMNDDFEGGEFIFTEMDAKTVTVSKSILANLSSIFQSHFCHFPRAAGFQIFLVLRIQEVNRDPVNLYIIKC